MKPTVVLVVLSLLLSVIIGVALSERNGPSVKPAQGVALDDSPLIGLSMDTLKEARWQRDRDIFVAEVEKQGGRVLVQSAGSDDTRQIKDVIALIANRVDVLVIIPHDGAAMAKAVALANKAKIPVIAYDRLITDSELSLYLSFDNVKVGEMQARYLVDKLEGDRGKIVRLYGAPTDNNARLFKQGQDNVLQPLIEQGKIRVLHEDWVTDWDPANAKKIMNAALTKLGDGFDGVLASNDGTAGGAIQALKEAGLAGKVIVTGQDADKVACQRIVRGTQSMTIYKPIQHLASRGAQLALMMARGEPIVARGAVHNGQREVPAVLLEVIPVSRENMLGTVIADGFHARDEIYQGSSGTDD